MMKKSYWGTVTVLGDEIEVRCNHWQAYEWAHRSGAGWPCSTLQSGAWARFDAQGDLVDVTEREIDGTELTAWSSDVLRDVLPDHPAIRGTS